jgi:tetratricopeptide (TPR) repeat protein
MGALPPEKPILHQSGFPRASSSRFNRDSFVHDCAHRSESPLQRAFALQPSSEHALAVGSLLVKLARYAEAEPLLRSAYNSLPSETAASRELGICALGLGRFSEAGNLLEAAGEGGEGDFRVYVLAASALTKASEHPRAAKCYAKAADRCVAGGGGQEECDLARGRLMEARQRVCDWGSWGAYAALEARLVQRRSRERVLSPFQVLDAKPPPHHNVSASVPNPL